MKQAKFMPYLIMGIFIALLFVALVIFSYILFIGLAIGAVLYVVFYIRSRFFGVKHPVVYDDDQGRVIDQK